jgi:hypothetical protein
MTAKTFCFAGSGTGSTRLLNPNPRGVVKMRRAAKVDSNHAEIVKTLRQVGCTVLDLSRVGQGCPDTLVAYGNRNVLMEIKREKRKGQSEGTLTPDQEEFFQMWRGPACVVHSPEEALAAVGFTVVVEEN